MSSVRSTQRQLKLGLRFSLLTILCLVAGLLLTACQSEADVSVKVGDDPTTQSNPATATPLPILVATPLPTATPVPTATPQPTPTPTPEPLKPNVIILGNPSNPLVEITRYQLSPNVQLEPLKLTSNLLADLNGWMNVTSTLSPAEGSSNLYRLVFSPEIETQIMSGDLKMVSSLAAEDGFRAMVRDSAGRFAGQGSLIPATTSSLIKPTAILFTVVSVVATYMYMDELNKQFETVNKNIQDIKNILQADRRSRLQGNLNYMDDIRKALNQQNLTPDELNLYHNQLETIERESQGDLDFYKNSIQEDTQKFRDVKLDKNLFFFRDEDKIRELQSIVNDFSRNSNSYLLVLSVRSMAAQLSCALPQSCQIALDRIQNVSEQLHDWSKDQTTFYDVVQKRVPEMDGLFADSKTRDDFQNTATTNRQAATDIESKFDNQLSQVMQKLQEQIKQGAIPIALVVELDNQGKIVKVSRLVN